MGVLDAQRRQDQRRPEGRRPQREAVVHPPHRVGDREGGPGVPGHGHRLHRRGRQAEQARARRREPGPRRQRGAQGRQPLAAGPGGARRGRRAASTGFRQAYDDLVGAHARRPGEARRAARGVGDAHQPGRPRHRRVRAAPDGGAGHDRRHRLDRVPAGPRQRAPGHARGPRRREGHDDDLDVRPPGHPGRGERGLPRRDRPPAGGRRRLLRGRAREPRPVARRRHPGRAGPRPDLARRRPGGRAAASRRSATPSCSRASPPRCRW